MIELLQHFDIALFFLINGTHHLFADVLMRGITQLGSGWVVGLLLVAIVIVKVRREHLVRVIVCGAVGLTLGGVINSQIKDAVKRERPVVYFQHHHAAADSVSGASVVTAEPAAAVRLLGPRYNSRSFPSGHTNTAFAAAAFCAVLFGGWWYAAFIAALAVGYSRVYLGVHFPLDVAAGGTLGVAVMLAVLYAGRCFGKQLLQRNRHAER